MDPRQLKDPAGGMPAQLLPHMHLVSRQRYPVLANPAPDAIVGYLLEAPLIVREKAPMQWQFIDAPADGTVFLTWQPSEQMGTNFASDGYVWGDAEQTFQSEVRGYMLQMMWHRVGFKPQAETVATHSRKRYRLIPNNPPGGIANPDSSLWLVCYLKAPPRDHHPAASLPINPVTGQQLQQRRLIQAQGQLPRKEFMLHDRNSWPVITLPGAMGVPGPQAPTAHRRGQSALPEVTVEEEEDVSRGDAIDFMTPRDLSRARYENHHEWMEEILESPYGTKQIIPPELGLGRKGALESLTNGFFTAPVDASQEVVADGVPPRVGNMSPGKAEEFTRRATQQLAEMQAELERIKRKHVKRIERLRKVTAIGSAEKRLRSTDEDRSTSGQESLDEIAGEIETLVGKKLTSVSNVSRVARGGMLDIQAPPAPAQTGAPTHASQTSSQPEQRPCSKEGPTPIKSPTSMQTNTSVDATQVTPSIPRQAPVARTSDPKSYPSASVPISLPSSTEETVESKPEGVFTHETQKPSMPDFEGADVPMEHVEDRQAPVDENNDGVPDDWIMVDEQRVADDQQGAGGEGTEKGDDGPVPTQDQPTPYHADEQKVQQPTPGPEPHLETNDFDMGDDFDQQMDTAGDALADFQAGEDLNLEDNFGDAFHHNDDEMS